MSTDPLSSALKDIDEAVDSGVSEKALDSYFASMDLKNLREQVQGAVNEYAEILRSRVIDESRIDILEQEVLGYDLEWFHERILESQNRPLNGKQLTLAFRGCGKSTVGTVGRVVYEIIKNPDIRILIASNTQLQAEIFLREIKEHFESNERLKTIFGNFVGSKWDAKEIIVRQRKKTLKESTVTCIGVGGPTASRHYDLIIGDDLVDEENSRTELQRDRLIVWFYKSLIPTLEPDARMLLTGTRWHPQDLYGHLIANTPGGLEVCILPAITKDGNSLWPDRFPIDVLLHRRAEMGVPIFETQFQMNTSSMQGKIFSWDMIHWYESLPANMVTFQGVDLAISQKEENDWFAHCTIGKCMDTGKIYVLEIYRTRKSFNGQKDEIVKRFFKHDPIKCGIEANAYQAAQVYAVQEVVGKRRVIPIFTLKDKRTRGMKLAAKCDNAEILFHKSQMHLVEELIKMPGGDHDDMFDALEIAVTTATTGIRKQRDNEPGIL